MRKDGSMYMSQPSGDPLNCSLGKVTTEPRSSGELLLNSQMFHPEVLNDTGFKRVVSCTLRRMNSFSIYFVERVRVISVVSGTAANRTDRRP